MELDGGKTLLTLLNMLLQNIISFLLYISIEPIFCHYAANYDSNQPGDKNNDFLYEAFPHLKRRIKMTGWEKSDNVIGELTNLIREIIKF